MNPNHFFFLRPYWLLALIPAAVLLMIYGRQLHTIGRSAWNRMVDPHLLPHLVVTSKSSKRSRWQLTAVTAGLIAAILAAAGPTWKKIELPAFKAQEPTVIVLSLAQSMNATDVSPSRLAHAGHKLRDILDRAKGGDFGFIIYSDRPFVAAPVTSDSRVITQMLPELSTNLMPVIGNRLNLAIDNARELLDRVDAHSGRIVVIADDAGIDPAESIAAAQTARRAGYSVSVLGVGTSKGAGMQTAAGQPIKKRNGEQAVTQLAKADLSQLANEGGGVFVTLTADNEDVDAILRATSGAPAAVRKTGSDFRADAWNDMGYWLLIIPVLLMPLAFRRNVLMALLPFAVTITFSLPAPDAMAAASLDHLWQTPDQQGAETFQQGNFDAAANQFENPDWKASSLYKAGQYGEAAQGFQQDKTPDGYYNLGNALANAGKLQPAIDAYDEALKQHPGDDDVQFNRDLVAQLLEQQKQQEQKQKDQQQQQQGGGQSQDQSGGEQKQNQSGGEQKQNQSGGEQNQNQSSDAQNQASAEQKPGQSGDMQNQGKPASEQDQAQSGGEENQDQAQAGQEQKPNPGGGKESQSRAESAQNPNPGRSENPQQQAADEDALAQQNQSHPAENDKGAFQRAMDKLLQGNGSGQVADEPSQTEPQSANASGMSELDQAHEQQLRAVPDDPSGLLRARIRQYYSQLNSNG